MKENRLELPKLQLNPGLVGLVEAVAALMNEDADELLGISSAAFCTYVFEPEFNLHEEERREFSELASFFSNYGPWESIRYYTGWEIRPMNRAPSVEAMKLLVFEIENGRGVVSLTPALEPTILTGYHVAIDERVAFSQAGALDLGDERLQGAHAVFSNWLLMVRPGEREEWAASQARQRVAVLRWTAEHAFNTREFFQETSENYVPGLEGLRRFGRLLDGLTDPNAADYSERLVSSLARARHAAAACIDRWTESIVREIGVPEVAEALSKAATSYRDASEAYASSATLLDASVAAIPHEEAAVDAIRRAAVHFPDVFEAS